MSRREIIECDRCGSIGDARTDRVSRGLIYAATLSGEDIVGLSDQPADLCAGCMNDLRGFISLAITLPGNRYVPPSEADVLRVINSCGGSSGPEGAEWNAGYDAALCTVDSEMRRLFSRQSEEVTK